MSPKDRDIRKPVVPPPNVAEQTATPDVSFDEATPITAMRAAAQNSKTAIELIAEAKDEIRAEIQASSASSNAAVKQYAETDQRDHAEMKGVLAGQNKTLEDQNKTLGEHTALLSGISQDVSGLKGAMVGVQSAMTIMTEAFKTGQVKERVELEATAQQTRMRTDFRLKRSLVWWKTAAKIVGAIGAVVGAGIASYYLGTWLHIVGH